MGNKCYSNKHKPASKNFQIELDKKVISNPNISQLSTENLNFPPATLQTSKEDIRKIYEINPKPIGVGKFGTVRIGSLFFDKTRKFAIKSIQKTSKNFSLIKSEILITRKLEFPFVNKIIECYEDNFFYHLVNEYYPEGNLLKKIKKDKKIEENNAKKIIYNLLLTVNYLHKNGVCHRDIKLENLMIFKDFQLVLIDFGLAIEFSYKNEEFFNYVGTPYYVAPEVIKKYNYKCDVWSIGVVAYAILCGKFPFAKINEKDLKKSILENELVFEESSWKNISDNAKDLISKLLEKDYKKRIDCLTALSHPWFCSQNPIEIQEEIYENILKKTQKYNILQMEFLKIIFVLLQKNEIEEISKKYLEFDNSNDELRYFDYFLTEFEKEKLTKEQFLFFYKYLTNNNKYITIKSLETVFLRLGKLYKKKEIEKMLTKNNFNKKKIEFKDFFNNLF